MQTDKPPSGKTKKCRKCSQNFPIQKFSMHLLQCEGDQGMLWKKRKRSSEEEICQNCGKSMNKQQFKNHQIYCHFQQSCQYCKEQYPEQILYNHQIMCRKNPTAKAIRRQYPSSSDEPDSSDQEQEWEMDEDYYYHKKEPQTQKQRPQHSSSSEEEETYEQKPERKKESYFHHKPKRQCTLSESSSEQDHHQRFWRTYHESFNVVPTQFYVRSLPTDLEGITIVVSSEGPNGRIIRRTVYNHQTGQSSIISNHRYERHYRSHVLQPEQTNNSNAFLIISNSLNNEPLTIQISNQVVGLSQTEIGKLKKSKWGGGEEDGQDKCIICYSEYQKAEDILNLKCSHFFHYGCVSQWLLQNPNCPLCKASQK